MTMVTTWLSTLAEACRRVVVVTYPEGLCTSRSNLLDIWVTWNHCWESRVRRIGGVGWDEESTCRLENLFNHDCGK